MLSQQIPKSRRHTFGSKYFRYTFSANTFRSELSIKFWLFVHAYWPIPKKKYFILRRKFLVIIETEIQNQQYRGVGWKKGFSILVFQSQTLFQKCMGNIFKKTVRNTSRTQYFVCRISYSVHHKLYNVHVCATPCAQGGYFAIFPHGVASAMDKRSQVF
jgi:hypothetical protein